MLFPVEYNNPNQLLNPFDITDEIDEVEQEEHIMVKKLIDILENGYRCPCHGKEYCDALIRKSLEAIESYSAKMICAEIRFLFSDLKDKEYHVN